MYKSLSEAMQHAKTAEQRKNEHGVDPTVWAAPAAIEENSEEAVKAKLCDLRIEATRLNAEIKEATARKYEGVAPLPSKVFHRLVARRALVAGEIAIHERQFALERSKRQAVAAQEAKDPKRAHEHEAFAEAFFEVAKEMLADDVMKRLIVAAAHRMPGRA